VLELGVLIAAPFAGRVLADFGAEVIKVEEPQRGDPLREWGQLRHEGPAGLVAGAEPEQEAGHARPPVVPRLSGTPGEARWTGPSRLGCHNADVYGGLLGLGPDELRALAEEGVI